MKKKGNKNLTYTQRLQIEALLNAGLKKQEIAERVGINVRTLYYELKRGSYEHINKVKNYRSFKLNDYKIVKSSQYSAEKAQQRYNFVCTARGTDLKIGSNFEFINFIQDKVINLKLSAAAVLGEINRKNLYDLKISKTTLYRYIKLGIFDKLKISKRKQRYNKVTIKRVAKGVSIEKRPEEISKRNSFGHWEMDCLCGSTKATWLVLSERLTRKEIIMPMTSQKLINVVSCLNEIEYYYGKMFKKVFKSITVDNGSEFLDYELLERSIYCKNNKRTQVYYCHPYCSCERGTNERLNREIRRLVPKGSDLSKYSKADIYQIEKWVNNYPRQVLNYATSEECFESELLKLKVS